MNFSIYILMKAWFAFCANNPDKIKSHHSALYFFILNHCNNLLWRETFGLPTDHVMQMTGIRTYKTYIQTLNDLIEFGFVRMVEKSRNQYTSNIIALVNFPEAPTKAKPNHDRSNNSIDIQINHNTEKQHLTFPR